MDYEYIDENELEMMFDDWLDETNEIITINGMEYLPSRVLEEIDPTAYNCEYSNWLDFMVDDLEEINECRKNDDLEEEDDE